MDDAADAWWPIAPWWAATVITEVASVGVVVLTVASAGPGCWSVLSSAAQRRRRNALRGGVRGLG